MDSSLDVISGLSRDLFYCLKACVVLRLKYTSTLATFRLYFIIASSDKNAIYLKQEIRLRSRFSTLMSKTLEFPRQEKDFREHFKKCPGIFSLVSNAVLEEDVSPPVRQPRERQEG